MNGTSVELYSKDHVPSRATKFFVIALQLPGGEGGEKGSISSQICQIFLKSNIPSPSTILEEEDWGLQVVTLTKISPFRSSPGSIVMQMLV